MKFNPMERIGVYKCGLAISENLGWIFREQPVADVGIDGYVELVIDGEAQGKLIALQVKSGNSYLKETQSGQVYYGDNEHLDYWLTHSTPVLLVAYTPKNDVLRWVHIADRDIKRTPKGWNIVVPDYNRFDKGSQDALLAIFDRAPNAREFRETVSKFGRRHEDFDSHVISIINDIAADLCLYNWKGWVEAACCTHIPCLHKNFVEGARAARVNIPIYIFPGTNYSDIELSAYNMIYRANDAVDLLLERAEYHDRGELYRGVHAYQRNTRDYNRDRREHTEWATSFVERFEEFTRSANLFCEVVREQLDPYFMLKQGRLVFSDDLVNWSRRPEYSIAQKRNILKVFRIRG